MTETREQSRSLLSLATAEAVLQPGKRRVTLRLVKEEKQTPGVFLKNDDEKSHTAHSTVDKNNSQQSGEHVEAENSNLEKLNSVLTNTMKFLEGNLK